MSRWRHTRCNCTPVARLSPLDRLSHRAPGVCLAHPRVEAGFIKVDDSGLLVHQLRELNRKLPPLHDELLAESCVVGGLRGVVTDLVLAVERSQWRTTHPDLIVLPDPLDPVLQSKPLHCCSVSLANRCSFRCASFLCRSGHDLWHFRTLNAARAGWIC